MLEKKKGFRYLVDRDQIERYRKLSLEQRLKWLICGNKLRKSLPERTISIQDAFREGKIWIFLLPQTTQPSRKAMAWQADTDKNISLTEHTETQSYIDFAGRNIGFKALPIGGPDESGTMEDTDRKIRKPSKDE